MKQSTKLALVLGLMLSATARAGEFAERHPRRAEVNKRVRNEERRINRGEKKGEISPEEAAKLRGELKGVKAQERNEVKANGGYLSKGEQKQLNQELNQDSKQIKEERHEGK